MAISQCVDNSLPLETSICVDEFTYASQSTKPWCGVSGNFHRFLIISGALLQFGALAAIIWWFFIVMNTWLMIKYHMLRKTYSNLEKYFLMIGWGIPALSVAISLGMKQFGANYTSTGGYFLALKILKIFSCWLLTTDNSAYQFSLFYGPLGLVLCIGIQYKYGSNN